MAEGNKPPVNQGTLLNAAEPAPMIDIHASLTEKVNEPTYNFLFGRRRARMPIAKAAAGAFVGNLLFPGAGAIPGAAIFGLSSLVTDVRWFKAKREVVNSANSSTKDDLVTLSEMIPGRRRKTKVLSFNDLAQTQNAA